MKKVSKEERKKGRKEERKKGRKDNRERFEFPGRNVS